VKFSYEELLVDPLPIEIKDLTKLEEYMCDEDFVPVFGMNKPLFFSLPEEQKKSLKTERCLYK
jgi:hypothetical protein